MFPIHPTFIQDPLKKIPASAEVLSAAATGLEAPRRTSSGFFEIGVDRLCQPASASGHNGGVTISGTRWSASTAIRARREQLGLSQAGLAKALEVSKSLLSHIEAGNRLPTEEQITLLSKLLRMPPDLLALGTGRLPDDVRDALSENAAEVVAAIRQHTEVEATRGHRSSETSDSAE